MTKRQEGRTVRFGAFELEESLPELNDPYVFAALHPWIDVNNVGSLTLNGLETQFEAKELGRLARPGIFFDFTRYRPTLYYEGDLRQVSVPNTTLRYARREGGNDLLFLRLLEPHAHAEAYVHSILRLLKALKVKRYCLLGSMYDAVPHTRPLVVNGGAMGREAEFDLKRSGALSSHYQGPTSIMTLITQMAPEFVAETIWFIVSLPQYVNLEEDHIGKLRLMEILNLLHHFPIDKQDFEKAAEQRDLIKQRVEKTPELKTMISQLETLYEVRIKREEGEKRPELSPEIEEILWKIMGKEPGKA
jgi:hypothetical protein